ncbi:uncharacterized protein LOC135961530 [Calliphora vicina]|uniref:uncharacterized protein LOC135961530 n=1 Tax=Calliphora vicina TaxID=7373 RepID=UPI00325B4450
MYNSNRLITLLLCTTITSGHANMKLMGKPQHRSTDFYKDLLMDIKTQQAFDSILMVQHKMPQDARLQMIYSLQEPKLIITNQTDFCYKEQFNNEIIAVVIIEREFSSLLWEHFLNALNYLRQTRILMIFVNIFNTEELQIDVLKACEKYKITNALLHFLNSSIPEDTSLEYFQLLPFPLYHLKLRQFGQLKEEYFPKHWQNMKGKTLLTLPDQIVPRSVMYKDNKGAIQFTGFVAKLIQMFAEVYNATLEMPFQPKIDEILNYNTLFNMTKYGELDMPMTIRGIASGSVLRYMTYPIEVSQWMIMIPCATRMTICEVYEVMLKPELFSIVLIFTGTFSLVHTVIEKLFYMKMVWQNLLMSDKVIPGVLGQSFNFKKSSLLSLRLIYVLIFVFGLYMSTLFSAHLQTLITRPPFNAQITTFEELRHSEQKILISSWDVQNMIKDDYILSEEMKANVVIIDDGAIFAVLRDNFNTTYGYPVPSASWSIYSNIQNHYAQKKFCVSENMNIRDMMLYGLPVGEHSPYKEPLDHLVHKIHAGGLLRGWKMNMPQDPRLQMIYSLQEPKLIITNQTDFCYKEQFNNEIIAVVIIEREFSSVLWEHFLNALNYLRQTRILMIFVNIFNTEELQIEVLKACEKYKITNGLLHFLNSSISEDTSLEYFQLLPFPQYHLKSRQFGQVKEEYFPIHWQNMKGKTLLTLPDQIVPRSVMYKDNKGQIQFSGFVAKLVQMFAEVYNATLEMPFQPKIGEILNYNTIFNMTKYGELDIPMTINGILNNRTLKHISYPTEVSQWMIMVPCATRMKITEIYEVMLKPQLFSIILIFTGTFSLVHTVIEKLFYMKMIWQNLLMSDKVIPGVLGQSFNFKKSSLLSLRLIYVLIFVFGLYISTLFSAHLQTLITKPPFHAQMSTFEDLRLSQQKILMSSWDVINLEKDDFMLSEEMKETVVVTDNRTLFEQLRDNFNTSYSYGVPSVLWTIYTNIQSHYAYNKFCVSENMNIKNMVLYGLPLAEHSPYQEPLDYLVHKIHSGGKTPQLIGILISLAAASAPSKTDNSNKKSKATEKPVVSDAKTTSKPAKSSATSSTGRSAKSLKTTKPGENRGKRTLYDFNNPSFLYPQIAARRAGYGPESRSAYSTQSGYFNGQNAIAQFPSDYHLNYSPYPQYLEAPEPIIEIIIKDANETLPEENVQPLTTKTKKKKEKVHVFYVNYKKDQNNKLHLESPIASLNNDETEEEEDEEEEIVHYPVTPLPPVRSTTLRTIIHPDSEKYHSNSGIHVTFGSEDKSQTGHILEEHDAESVQRQVVAVPVPQTGVKSQYQLNARNDFQGQARSPFTSSFFQSSAPWQYQAQQQQQQYHSQQQQKQTQHQQQQLPHQHSNTYFKPPTSTTTTQQQQPPQHSSQHHSTNYYQKQPFQQQSSQQKPHYTSNPPASAPAASQQSQRKPLSQIHQQLQQQSQYYVNHNQLYQQQPQQQQQQHHQQQQQQHHHQQQSSVQHNQYYNSVSHKPTQSPKSSVIFPSAPPKTQELPVRHAPQPYQPIKFRPTPAPAPQQTKPTPIAAKLENTQYNSKPYQFQKQPQYIQHPTFTVSPPASQQNYKTQQQQQHSQTFAQSQTSNQPQTNSIYYTQNKQQQQQTQVQQNTRYQTQSSSQQTSAAHPNTGLSWLDIKPSKETELLKSIPKFEQHITETVQNHYNPNQYQSQNQVIHDIPSPNLAPQQPQSQALQGHYITASSYNNQPQVHSQQQQQTYTNFVTASSNLHHAQQTDSTTQSPQFGEATDGQKIMIVTPMPPNVYQQYQTAHTYQTSQSSNNNQQHSTQIINSVQPSQEQYNNYYQQPRQGQSATQAQSALAASNSPYSVSNYHSDVFKELEQRNSQTHETKNNQNAYIPTSFESSSTTTTPSTTSSSSTTVNPKTLLQLPDEVPDDLRQQLLSSGILGNADISVLDYDKVGDIALENLPAEHLQHFYGAGGGAQISASKKVLSVVKPNGDRVSLDEKEIERVKQSSSVPHHKQTDVKVVRFDGQQLENSEAPSSSGERQYNRYLPLKIHGANFPKPNSPELQGKFLQSVVVLAPVDTPAGQDAAVVEDSKEVKFLGGDLIKTLVKKPTKENFKRWLEKESRTDVDQQSVVLLVAKSSNSSEQEIFMYDITTGEVNKLNGELSSKFVSVAEENASTEDLEHGSTLDPNFMETMMKPLSS